MNHTLSPPQICQTCQIFLFEHVNLVLNHFFGVVSKCSHSYIGGNAKWLYGGVFASMITILQSWQRYVTFNAKPIQVEYQVNQGRSVYLCNYSCFCNSCVDPSSDTEINSSYLSFSMITYYNSTVCLIHFVTITISYSTFFHCVLNHVFLSSSPPFVLTRLH